MAAPYSVVFYVTGETGESHYHLGFYMGGFGVSQRADLTGVYEMIFRRPKQRWLGIGAAQFSQIAVD